MNDHRSKFSNLSSWKEKPEKKQGFNGIRTRDLRDTGAMLYQLSYEATHWERGQLIEFISSSYLPSFIYSRSSNMNYFIYISQEIYYPTISFPQILTCQGFELHAAGRNETSTNICYFKISENFLSIHRL